jgi:hypothetical protein
VVTRVQPLLQIGLVFGQRNVGDAHLLKPELLSPAADLLHQVLLLFLCERFWQFVGVLVEGIWV